MKFLNFIHHKPTTREAVEEPQKPIEEPSGEIESQITFVYKDLRFNITRLYDAALGKYSVVANVGDWQKVESGLSEAQAEEVEDSIYALVIPQTIKAY